MKVKTIACAIALTLFGGAASAQDTVRLAIGQRGNWDTSVSEIGQRAGIFKKHGLVLEIVYTQGAGETQQAVISGSVDLGIAAGVMGVLSAYSKGAPVRIISAETTGAKDLYWYVKADSPIKSLKDTEGKTLAYSTNGSSTHGIVTAFMKQYDLKAKPTAMGGPAANLTAVMSGQVDVGWAAPPFGLDQLDKGDIRIVATGNDADVFRGQTVRLNIANAQFRDDPGPVEQSCGCECCGSYSRAYLSHLFHAKELLFHRLASIHNLAHYLAIARRAREVIATGAFPASPW